MSNYEEHSHTHCWDQKKDIYGIPPCAIPLKKHMQCCLCSKNIPLEVNESQENTGNDTFSESTGIPGNKQKCCPKCDGINSYHCLNGACKCHTNKSQEEGIRKSLKDVYYEDFVSYDMIDAKFEDVYELFLLELARARADEREKVSKSFGGCTRCYGKGYATQLEFYRGHGFHEQADYYLPCSCERGNQFREALERTKAATRLEVIKMMQGEVAAAVKNAAKLVEGWHYKKGGYGVLAEAIRESSRSK